MGKNIRSSSSPKALATSFPMPPLADAMDAVRLSVDRFCLLAGVEALAEMMEDRDNRVQAAAGWRSWLDCTEPRVAIIGPRGRQDARQVVHKV